MAVMQLVGPKPGGDAAGVTSGDATGGDASGGASGADTSGNGEVVIVNIHLRRCLVIQ